MRRFLLLVFGSCAAAAAAFSLWPGQLAGYVALFGQHTSVNSGVAVTVLAVLTLLLAALRVRLWRSERDLARLRRGLAQPMVPAAPVYPAYPPYPVSSWGARPLR
jgi:membrane protein implicated in regulation of membrane protease activity